MDVHIFKQLLTMVCPPKRKVRKMPGIGEDASRGILTAHRESEDESLSEI